MNGADSSGLRFSDCSKVVIDCTGHYIGPCDSQ